MQTLQEHENKWKACTLCKISQHCTHRVIGRGSVPADILMLGEAPGTVEDYLGLPFVGPAGDVLNAAINRIVEQGWQFTYYISNIVACRPVNYSGDRNRSPESLEIMNCSPRVVELIKLIRPKLIILMGETAKGAFLGLNYYDKADLTITIKSIVHPAFICRKGGVGSPDFDLFVKKLKGIICGN